MAFSQFSKVDEYGFVRPDDFDYKTYESFMSEYLQILAKKSKKWTYTMASRRALRRKRSLKKDIRKGIPSEYREKVWMHVSGANEAKLKLGSDVYKKMLEAPHDSELEETIRTDLPRTFPDNIFFNSTNVHQEMLFRVLIAYGTHNRHIGYCQGMNYIAGLLLLVTKNEDSTFWLLKMLVEKILPDYYSPTMDGLLTDIDTVSELVRLRYPEVSRHVTELGLPWAVISTKWFVCLYCEVLPTETVLRVWDCLFNEGSKILFRVALAVIGLHRQQLVDTTQFGELSETLKSIVKSPSVLHCHNFLKNMFKGPGKMTGKNIMKIRERMHKERKDKNNKNNRREKEREKENVTEKENVVKEIEWEKGNVKQKEGENEIVNEKVWEKENVNEKDWEKEIGKEKVYEKKNVKEKEWDKDNLKDKQTGNEKVKEI